MALQIAVLSTSRIVAEVMREIGNWPEVEVTAIVCRPQSAEKAHAWAAEYGVPCQVSMEERMACGVGACLGCATPIRRDDGSVTYLHVCKDGPVFEAERVVFDD